MSRTLRTTIGCTILAIAASGAAAAEAAVLYSTIPDSYVNNPLPINLAPDSGWPDYSASGWTVFDHFTLSQNASSIDLGVYNYVLGSGFAGVNWSIWTSNNGAPGVEIGSGTATGSAAALIPYVPPAADQPGASLVTVNGAHANAYQVLTADVTYFLEFQIIFNPDSNGSSEYATTGVDTQTTYMYDGSGPPINHVGGSYYPQLAFYIQGGSTVPEPSTWAMLIVGFAGLGWTARRFARARAT